MEKEGTKGNRVKYMGYKMVKDNFYGWGEEFRKVAVGKLSQTKTKSSKR